MAGGSHPFVLFILGLLLVHCAARGNDGGASPTLHRHLTEQEKSNKVKREGLPSNYSTPDYYPTPHGGWVSSWTEAYAKAQLVVSNMTLAEKVNITSGTGYFMGPCVGQTGSALRFGIPRLCLQDSPLGIRDTENNTAFPAGVTTGATWDKELIYARGVAIGEEARGKGVNVQMGPVVGPIGRKPKSGRIWEGFGADPSLQGLAAVQTIQGMQSVGVIATLKHFILNEQEMYRMTDPVQVGYSSDIDDRTMHEIYLWPFAEGVRAGVGSVMAAYNHVNGSLCTQNSEILNGILKDELGFQGFVMSDWYAQDSGVPSALAGLDMAMPGDGAVPLIGVSWWNYELSTAVLNGTVPLERLNDMVTRVVAAWYQMGQDDDYPLPNFSSNTEDAVGPLYPGALFSPTGVVNQFVNVQGNHSIVARAVARDAITLLKNVNETLPLSSSANLSVFGTDAGPNSKGLNSCTDMGCDNGILTMGWGSGTSRLPYVITPEEAIQNVSANTQFYITDTFPSVTPNADEIAIVFINSDSGENYITVDGNPGDRLEAKLAAWHSGDELVVNAAAAFSTVIVVVHTVGPIIMEDWIDLPSVKGVLVAHLPGQEAGNSLVDVLFGDYSPSGHLPYTIPHNESEYPASVDLIDQVLGQIQDQYLERLYIDYRHFLQANITPRFPFGYGLSYTTFNFSDATIISGTTLTQYPPARASKGPTPTYATTIPPASEVAWPTDISSIWRYLYPYLDDPEAATSTAPYPYPTGYSTTPHAAPRAGGSQGGNPALWDTVFTISVKVTNTGTRPGRAVAQLYVELPADALGVDLPPRQLRQFEKTSILSPGDSETLTLPLTRKDLSVWDVVMQDWLAPVDGEGVKFWIGQSVATEDLQIVCTVGQGCESTS
ncbi:putative beta-glucosidase F [Talaromyces atroroseus]|uniref:beta-glucosidase n=1 Tax=Talaromyces atroroseus TaxID=1441469 RepID=A0A225ASC2_TALAT|nr:putative beta-glucosidase F [Talaromyces atroroseus]OKL61254.1 putative beta-glucosidase F [Talaromyces atroroseus]